MGSDICRFGPEGALPLAKYGVARARLQGAEMYAYETGLAFGAKSFAGKAEFSPMGRES